MCYVTFVATLFDHAFVNVALQSVVIYYEDSCRRRDGRGCRNGWGRRGNVAGNLRGRSGFREKAPFWGRGGRERGSGGRGRGWRRVEVWERGSGGRSRGRRGRRIDRCGEFGIDVVEACNAQPVTQGMGCLWNVFDSNPVVFFFFRNSNGQIRRPGTHPFAVCAHNSHVVSAAFSFLLWNFWRCIRIWNLGMHGELVYFQDSPIGNSNTHNKWKVIKPFTCCMIQW